MAGAINQASTTLAATNHTTFRRGFSRDLPGSRPPVFRPAPCALHAARCTLHSSAVDAQAVATSRSSLTK